jgi:transketolase
LNGKPKLIIIKTIIGFGISQVAGTNKAHGEAGVKFVEESKKGLGLPNEPFFVDDKVKAYFSSHKATLVEKYNAWTKVYDAWKAANPTQFKVLDDALNHRVPSVDELLAAIPEFKNEEIATRKAGQVVIQPLAKAVPVLISGSADLHGSTLNYINSVGDFSRENRAGRNLYYGIREFAMGCIVNGLAYHGIFRASGATFFTFSDFLRPAFRLAALAHLPVFHIFTHDSVGVGEDGPTHQPVETLAAVRAIPNCDVIR